MKIKRCLTLILTTATFLSIPLLAANLNAATTSNKRIENSKLKLGLPTRDGSVPSIQLAQNNEAVETPDPNQEVDTNGANPAEDPSVQRGLALAEQVYNANDPVQARSDLTVEEQNLVDSVTQPAALEVQSQPIDSAPTQGAPTQGASTQGASTLSTYTGCWGLNQSAKRKALLGNTLYTYWQTTQVCARNGRVTSVAVTNAGGETSTPGWRIARNPTTSTKNVGWEGRGLARYYFVLGAGGIDVQNPTDCIQMRLNGNGRNYRYLSSCNLDAS
ncbi:hypothetical protein [Scytonema sp. NUACC26]|uniref:hypothetical protein n=1 Tax=Scytonema sp. NUACC26 TaxID=3140176 RepID=UPI0034DC0778